MDSTCLCHQNLGLLRCELGLGLGLGLVLLIQHAHIEHRHPSPQWGFEPTPLSPDASTLPAELGGDWTRRPVFCAVIVCPTTSEQTNHRQTVEGL